MKFTVNGNEYEGAKYDFNTHCNLSEMGVNALDIRKKPESVARAYFAISSGLTTQEAGEEMEKHIIAGGDLSEIIIALLTEMDQSDFFRSITKRNQVAPKRGTRKAKETTEV